ncbi:right-handed parallel beta-helix repeat-containing protein [Parvularcula flava]|uniref:Right-handed parallel beta-helix repeat-containing protein n=1 Tax=Aquisalinus luteolus TaxID=1566827 RepID=A0A8J3A5G0_9PROT|nr:right-handed parallel beta-helix repeat-containing protein [Aquisalinus luteolus]NHK28921.1 right-handed parallel beta-helix repeat-containing protein [Aquisalinus luteolus]GGI00851.1 hypothetical protein GCM10011355_30120 [Aquisalinus luteolus]
MRETMIKGDIMKSATRLAAGFTVAAIALTGTASAQFGGFPTVTKQDQIRIDAQKEKTASKKSEAKLPSYLVVDSRAHGDDSYTSIQEAINDVAPGGVVVVLPGVYRENITLTKSVSLQGDRGPGGQVRVMPTDSSKPCLTYSPEGSNDHALVSNMQFDFSDAVFATPGSAANKAVRAGFGSASPCVAIKSGVFTMKETTVDGGNIHFGTMVEITGGTAFLERNEIRGGEQGVLINQKHPLWDRTLLVDNVITGNTGIGLHMQGASTMLVTGNMINANGKGITYNGEGGATMVGNKILNNAGDGVTLGEQAKQVLIRLNQIWANDGDGLKIYQSNGLVEDNDIKGNVGLQISSIGNGNKPKIYNDVEREISRMRKQTN